MIWLRVTSERKAIFHCIIDYDKTYRSSNSLKRLDFKSSSFNSAVTSAHCFSVSSIAASSFLSSSSIFKRIREDSVNIITLKLKKKISLLSRIRHIFTRKHNNVKCDVFKIFLTQNKFSTVFFTSVVAHFLHISQNFVSTKADY